MILILGGTRDAHQIALGLQQAGIDFVLSLAGVTRKPVQRPYVTRTGGFGGVDGLAEYLGKKEITGLIDATHPFAENISRSAVVAATAAGVPLMRYVRPKWDGAGFHNVSDLHAAAHTLPSRARAFLTVGGKSLDPFTHRSDVWFLFRGVDPMENPFVQGEALVQRPPFTLEAETTLMAEYGITHLVAKNSGGAQTRAKLDAAVELGIAVILVERPVLPMVENVSTVSDILRWAEAI